VRLKAKKEFLLPDKLEKWDSEFNESLNDSERRVWRTFKAVTTTFMENFKVENYGSLV
jgi:hypothetical protein